MPFSKKDNDTHNLRLEFYIPMSISIPTTGTNLSNCWAPFSPQPIFQQVHHCMRGLTTEKKVIPQDFLMLEVIPHLSTTRISTLQHKISICQYVRSGLNSHYFPYNRGWEKSTHQPNSRGLYTHCKDSVIKGGRSPIPNKTRLLTMAHMFFSGVEVDLVEAETRNPPIWSFWNWLNWAMKSTGPWCV